MGKRVRITNDVVNDYGFRLLTSGGDLRQYERNPVLLYMHERGAVIGCMTDIRHTEDELIGEPVFDEASELSQRCKKQWEFGSLRMVSVGIDILETSDAPELLLPGQTRPTITKWRLNEISIVDIGANDDAIVLYKDGQKIELGKDGECHLLPIINNQQNQRTMSEKTEKVEKIDAQLEQLQKENTDLQAQVKTLQEENDRLKLAGITGAVEKAIAEKRLDAEKKAQFVELGKKVGIEELEGILGAMTPKAKLSAVLNGGQRVAADNNCEWKTLHDVPAEKMMELRNEHPEEYQRLYKATYQL